MNLYVKCQITSAASQENGDREGNRDTKEARAEVAMSEQLATHTHMQLGLTEPTEATIDNQKEVRKMVSSLADRPGPMW